MAPSNDETTWSGGPGASDDDPFGGREPTSHERMTGEPWDASYLNGPAPWDIGRPQPAFVELGSTGRFVGPVLDAGCGTGENALLVASTGLTVVGVDVAETALAMARAKAEHRALDVEFVAADALRLDALARSFRTVLDCGLFHSFDAGERTAYAASLASVTQQHGMLHLLCFSDEGQEPGPHPVSRDDLTAAFSPETGWTPLSIESSRVHTTFHEGGAPAWLATIERQ